MDYCHNKQTSKRALLFIKKNYLRFSIINSNLMKSFFASVLVFVCATLWSQPKAPQDFLPKYGDQVQFYDDVLAYFAHLDKESPYVKTLPYGNTTQGRPLRAYVITSPENHQNLESIRKKHLGSIGLDAEQASMSDKSVVWLSFNVHGNEIGSIESAIAIVYELIKPQSTFTNKLNDVIIILDPCLNPDGFARYSHWLRDISGKFTHPGLYDREHMEPWPGGRQNHYVFDLNRDWAWQTQLESRLRMQLYQKWMPMVHIDVHEMGYNDHYYFPPAAEPFHQQITDYQRRFHQKIGERTAPKFDEKGWLYYSGERFDLFYPSYGDTYPSFNGAVGMTYEKAGIGAGRAILTKNGEILTIRDRIEHHKVAVLEAVSLSIDEGADLRKAFVNFFKESRSKPKGTYQTYILKNQARTSDLLNLLDLNGISYTYNQAEKTLTGYSYKTHKDEKFSIAKGDVLISTDQPRSVLAQVLFEPYHKLSDSLSYDITAWALPWAFGVDAFALKTKLNGEKLVQRNETAEFSEAYAWYFPWGYKNAVQSLAHLLQHQVKVRSVDQDVVIQGKTLKKGGLLVLQTDNATIPNLLEVLQKTTVLTDVISLQSGFSGSGQDLGGGSYPLIKAPKIMILGGLGVSNIDFGQVWHFLDEWAMYPHSKVELAYFDRIDWNEYNVLILPDGNYRFTDSQQKKLDAFLQKGGRIIAINGALKVFENQEGYALKPFATDESKKKAEQAEEERSLNERTLTWEGGERREISNQISGAIIENKMDATHPLGYGIGATYYSLKTNEQTYELLKNAENVCYVPKNYKSSGFIGKNIRKELEDKVTFAVERKGRGAVIYMVDNPLFRGFWEVGNLLFANALFRI